MSLNLSGFFNVFRCLASPSLCLPHATVSTFSDLPIPLDKAFNTRKGSPAIEAVVLDKDDCFAYPHSNTVHASNKVSRGIWMLSGLPVLTCVRTASMNCELHILDGGCSLCPTHLAHKATTGTGN